MEATAAAGIELHGLTKTFRGSHGPVHAVRGVDVSIAPGETVYNLSPATSDAYGNQIIFNNFNKDAVKNASGVEPAYQDMKPPNW